MRNLTTVFAASALAAAMATAAMAQAGSPAVPAAPVAPAVTGAATVSAPTDASPTVAAKPAEIAPAGTAHPTHDNSVVERQPDRLSAPPRAQYRSSVTVSPQPAPRRYVDAPAYTAPQREEYSRSRLGTFWPPAF